jgi:poly(A) polymerase
MSHQQTEQIAEILETRTRFREVFQMREATLQRLIRRPDFGLHLAFHRAEAMASDGNLIHYEFWSSRWSEWQKSSQSTQKLLTGEDLVELGLKPGPKFAEILRAVEDLQLESKLTSQSQALEYVVKHFVR